MTGGPDITLTLEVYCENHTQDGRPSQKYHVQMRLIDDVEGRSAGEYECPACRRTVTVELRIGNEH